MDLFKFISLSKFDGFFLLFIVIAILYSFVRSHFYDVLLSAFMVGFGVGGLILQHYLREKDRGERNFLT